MSQLSYPEQLEIKPNTGRGLSATVTVPGSKSITNRALVLAALSSREGPCTLTGVLQSEDTEVMVDSLHRLGFHIDADWDRQIIRVHANRSGRVIPATQADLHVANSGTTMRFLTAMVSLGSGQYRLDGIERMRERPIRDLIEALTWFGVDVKAEGPNGCPPVLVNANGWTKWISSLRMGTSSQFLSGLMMAAPFSGHDEVLIQFADAAVSMPYLTMTDSMLHQWGVVSELDSNGGRFSLPRAKNTPYRDVYAIEPDASAASYFFAAAAILGGRVTVEGLTLDSLQGDVHFVKALEQMGCRVETCSSGITVHGGKLHGIDIDMNAISDTVMTLGAVACFADGPTTIRNVAHIRHKETDRIAALANELRRVGADVDEFADGLKITPRPLHGARVETYNDHRMAMSMALIGLKIPGVVIQNPGCVAKTYPGFWQDLERAIGR